MYLNLVLHSWAQALCFILLAHTFLQTYNLLCSSGLVCFVVQHAEDWTSHTPDCHVFSVLLLKCPGPTLQTLLPQSLCVIGAALQDPDR